MCHYDQLGLVVCLLPGSFAACLMFAFVLSLVLAAQLASSRFLLCKNKVFCTSTINERNGNAVFHVPKHAGHCFLAGVPPQQHTQHSAGTHRKACRTDTAASNLEAHPAQIAGTITVQWCKGENVFYMQASAIQAVHSGGMCTWHLPTSSSELFS